MCRGLPTGHFRVFFQVAVAGVEPPLAATVLSSMTVKVGYCLVLQNP